MDVASLTIGTVPTEKGKTMADTTLFVQCENCECCEKEIFGYVCAQHSTHIDNPKIDGCTWGREKEERSDAA